MTKKRLKKSNIQNANTLAIKMMISLIMAVAVGAVFIFLREYLILNDKSHIWDTLNKLLFQDITAEDSKDAIGLFYILGQLFINSLQLVIVPMIFSSIALAMCRISDTKKLGRISTKTLLGFLVTSVLVLIMAGIFAFIGYKAGLFNIEINGGMTKTEVVKSGNPLMVLIDAVPNNVGQVFSTNGRVLAVVFVAVVTGLSINTLGDKINSIKGLLEDVNNIINVFLNYIIVKFSPAAVFILIVRTFAVYGID
ncbi:MAG: cation:dicarboxylate symporter family transporter, partial [Clostridium sp.]